jgi:hypothetical protein
MPSLQSDLALPPAKFDRANIDPETRAFNEKLIKIWADGPRWYEVRPSSHRYQRPLRSPL